VLIGHDAKNVGDADVVVFSSAVSASNPELLEARRRQIPVIPRAEMLAGLMRLKAGIAVAGAHGKTTTSSMIALVLERAGLDPTAVIGGRVSAFGSNARLGRGDYMVVEADESDRSFLRLSPTIAVVTNVDREHLDTYGSFEQVVEAFTEFAAKVPFYGAVVGCADDHNVKNMLRHVPRRSILYGFDEGADVRGLDVVTDGTSGCCRVTFRLRDVAHAAGEGQLRLQVPGVHNLQNALAAIAVGLELGVSFEQTAEALAAFRGVERRYQVRGSAAGVTVVDDYGHHPTEVAAVLRAARAGRPRRLVVVFQPHRYTRTRDLLEDFGRALSLADVVVLTDIYPAGEQPIPGVSLDALARVVARQVDTLHVIPALADVAPFVAGVARPGDLVITLGAGSIGNVGDRILTLLGSGSERGAAS
jgi:UDP-N-acetylmuramate--alanine ligase